MADKMNGAAVHLGAIATTMGVQVNGGVNTTIPTVGVIEVGMEAIAPTMDTNRSMTTTMNMPTRDITKAATAAVPQIFQAVKPMAHSIQQLTWEKATTMQPSTWWQATEPPALGAQALRVAVAMTTST